MAKKKASKKKVAKKVTKKVVPKIPKTQEEEMTFRQKRRLYAEKQAADFRKRFPRD